MFDTLTAELVSLSKTIPLEAFTFLGSFVEEVLAPIPSPIVMTVTGSLAEAQEKPLAYLLVLSLIGATGKTLGAIIVYWISRVLEEAIFKRFGKFMGVTHEEIVNLGKKLDGTWKDMTLLTFFRALPVMSSSVVSVCSGFVRVRQDVYIVSTFLGTIVRDFFYLYVGYTGIAFLQNLVSGFDSMESIIQALIGLFIISIFATIVIKRKKAERLKRPA